MKRTIQITFTFALLTFAGVSCKKCQTCETKVTQEVFGYDQTTASSDEYCGDDYDNAPEPGTYTQNAGGVDQTVVITCQDN